jgi:hypothetical protein
MIPFLKHSKEASVAMPADTIERKPDDGSDFDPLESAAEDLCNAIEAKDYKSAAAAIRAAFELLESQPHEEGEHIG